MSMKSKTKEVLGTAEEELGEGMHNTNMADKGRQLRNEGRIGSGKLPKTNVPGTGKSHP